MNLVIVWVQADKSVEIIAVARPVAPEIKPTEDALPPPPPYSKNRVGKMSQFGLSNLQINRCIEADILFRDECGECIAFKYQNHQDFPSLKYSVYLQPPTDMSPCSTNRTPARKPRSRSKSPSSNPVTESVRFYLKLIYWW